MAYVITAPCDVLIAHALDDAQIRLVALDRHGLPRQSWRRYPKEGRRPHPLHPSGGRATVDRITDTDAAFRHAGAEYAAIFAIDIPNARTAPAPSSSSPGSSSTTSPAGSEHPPTPPASWPPPTCPSPSNEVQILIN